MEVVLFSRRSKTMHGRSLTHRLKANGAILNLLLRIIV
jgi:hypothetical protein